MLQDVWSVWVAARLQVLGEAGSATRWPLMLQGLSDLLIGIAYVTISLTLLLMVRRSHNSLPFHRMFLAFSLFIIACGATHFMRVVVLLTPLGIPFLAIAQAVTVGASVATALTLPGVVPRVLALVNVAKRAEEREEQLESRNR